MSDKAALKQLKFFLPANENSSQFDTHVMDENLDAILNINKAAQSLTLEDWRLLLEQLAKLKLTDSPSAKNLFTLLNTRLPQSLERLVLYLHLRTMHGTPFLEALQTFSPPQTLFSTLKIGQRCGTFSLSCRQLADHMKQEQKLSSFSTLSIGPFLSLASIFLCTSLACWQLPESNIAWHTASWILGGAALLLTMPICVIWGYVQSLSWLAKKLPAASRLQCDKFLFRTPYYGKLRLLRELNRSCRIASMTDLLGGSTSEVQQYASDALSSPWLKAQLHLTQLPASHYISLPYYLQQYAKKKSLTIPLQEPDQEGDVFFIYLKNYWEKVIAIQTTSLLYTLLGTTLPLMLLMVLDSII